MLKFTHPFFEADDGGKTFTQEQIDKLIGEAFAKGAAKKEKELQDAQEQQRQQQEEKDRQSKLTDAEKQNEAFEAMRRQVEELKKDKVRLTLKEKGIADDLVDLIPTADDTQTQAVTERLIKFKDGVEAPLKARITELEEQLKNAGLRNPAPKDPSKSEPTQKQAVTGII